LYRDTHILPSNYTRLQKHVPYLPRTGTVTWLKFMDTARMLRQVTQPPHIAGPLGLIWNALLLRYHTHDRLQKDTGPITSQTGKRKA